MGRDAKKVYGEWFCDFDLLACWVRAMNQEYILPHYIEYCGRVGLPCILQG